MEGVHCYRASVLFGLLAYVARHASAASSFPPRETTFLDALFISQQLIETSLSAVDDINMHVLGPFELWSGFAASQTASFISTVIVSKKKKKKNTHASDSPS
jgi:hypothetical protein